MSSRREILVGMVRTMALFVAITVFAEQPAPAEDGLSGPDSATMTDGPTTAKRSPTLRIGVFLTLALVAIPFYMMFLYSIILNNSSTWPTTLFGVCLGLWGATVLISFGWIFPAFVPLKDYIPGPWSNYRLQQVTTILALIWGLGSFFYYRRPVSTAVAK